MDFLARGTQPVHHQPPAHHPDPTPKSRHPSRWLGRLLIIVGLGLVALLALWMLLTAYKDNESRYVNSSQYQAVFLTDRADPTVYGSVFFGKISELNNKFIVITDVFTIATTSQEEGSSSTASASYILRKLGSNTLLVPDKDEVIINREQVSYWENLKDDSPVVKKIEEYKANPSGAGQDSSGSSTTVPESTSP